MSRRIDGWRPSPLKRRPKLPLYWRLLRLRHVHPNGWQRALLADLPIAVAVVLVLADVASAWTLLALPVAVALAVKANDLLVGLLRPSPPVSRPAAAPVERSVERQGRPS